MLGIQLETGHTLRPWGFGMRRSRCPELFALLATAALCGCYGSINSPIELDDGETRLIVSFLESLTGEYKGTPVDQIAGAMAPATAE